MYLFYVGVKLGLSLSQKSVAQKGNYRLDSSRGACRMQELSVTDTQDCLVVLL